MELADAAADPRFYGVVLHDIADVHRAQGDLEQAARMYERAAEHKRRGNASSRDLAVTLLALAEVHQDLGATAEALRAGTDALQILGVTAPEFDPHFRAEILVFTARLQLQSDPEQALALLEQAHQLLAPEEVAEPLERVTVLDLIAKTHRAIGREDEAREAAAKSNAILAVSATTLNISWPWNDETSSIADTSYEITNDRLYIMLRPGHTGLRFNKRLVRFTEGERYKDLDISADQEHKSRHDYRALVISLPYMEDSIEKVTYNIDHGLFTLIVHSATAETRMRSTDIEFFRKPLS